MYLEHFQLEQFPFSITPNTEFFCNLESYQEALNVLLLGLHTGEGFIKVTGEVGVGKTLLCRKVLNSLEKEFVTAYIPNPDLSAKDLRRALARELDIPVADDAEPDAILSAISERLMTIHASGKRVVLLLDEAQFLPLATLEAIRLLTNLETETTKLLQVVLFGQPELDRRLKQPNLRQLRQRITFSYQLRPLAFPELDAYVCHRLATAGYRYGQLFSAKALALLFKSSRGIPRVINILCHKAMMVGYGKGERIISARSMRTAIADTEGAIKQGTAKQKWVLGGAAICATFVGAKYYALM